MRDHGTIFLCAAHCDEGLRPAFLMASEDASSRLESSPSASASHTSPGAHLKWL